MYVNSLACARAKEGESDCFRIDSGVRRVYHVPLAFQFIDTVVKMDLGKRGEIGDYLASCVQMTWFCVVSQRRT